MEKSVLKERDISEFPNKISIVKFLKIVRNKGVESFGQYSVYGLEDLLYYVGDREEMVNYIHNLLRERVDYLISRGSTFQFIIGRNGSVETWSNKPIIKLADKSQIKLRDLFNSQTESPEDDPNWYWYQFNIVS